MNLPPVSATHYGRMILSPDGCVIPLTPEECVTCLTTGHPVAVEVLFLGYMMDVIARGWPRMRVSIHLAGSAAHIHPSQETA